MRSELLLVAAARKRLLARREALLREVAEIEVALGLSPNAAVRPTDQAPDADPSDLSASKIPDASLTERQAAVLKFIARSIQERGFPPSLREIGVEMGIGSTNGVADHLRRLVAKGFVVASPMTSRGLRLTKKASEWLAPLGGDGGVEGGLIQ